MTAPTAGVRHIIVDRPMRCWAQVATMYEAIDDTATVHMTPRFLGEPRRKHPGMGSGCMPRTERGYDRCRHDLAELRQQGAIDIDLDTACRTWEPGPCPTCGGKWRADGQMAYPDEYPATAGQPWPNAQETLF